MSFFFFLRYKSGMPCDLNKQQPLCIQNRYSPDAFDHEDTLTASDLSLLEVLDCVKSIFQDACHCTEFGRDENAWCYHVIWLLTELAMKLYGNAKFKLESVYSLPRL